ncbi:hypothetical protein [Bosea sp. ASV33]|uniref:hypothetical protein n=1 Tax=Bosea sp. ASV33 TaxID=2795106 RepID=UPI0018EC2F60|nr:hypothetical protein [Bosea sp. ASV33]
MFPSADWDRLLRICETGATLQSQRRSGSHAGGRVSARPFLGSLVAWLSRGAPGTFELKVGRLTAKLSAGKRKLIIIQGVAIAKRQVPMRGRELLKIPIVLQDNAAETRGVTMVADIPISQDAQQSISQMTCPRERHVTTLLLSRICLAIAAAGCCLGGSDLRITDPFVSNLAGYIFEAMDEAAVMPISISYGGIEITFEMGANSDFPLSVISVTRA